MTEIIAGTRNQMMSEKDWEKLESTLAPKKPQTQPKETVKTAGAAKPEAPKAEAAKPTPKAELKKEASYQRNGMTFETLDEIHQLGTKTAAEQPSAAPVAPAAPPTMTGDPETLNLQNLLAEKFPNTETLLRQYGDNPTVVNTILIVLREIASSKDNIEPLIQAVEAHAGRKA